MSKWENIAYKEYYRTLALSKEISAFNFQHKYKERKLNQYVIKYTFEDGSKLHVSSCKCRTNLNYMLCITKDGDYQAQRILF